MIPWWDKYGGEVYRREILELRDYVGEFEVDFSSGKLTIRAFLEIDGKRTPAEICYPDNYPYFPAMVFAEGLDRPRHYSRAGGNLCLLGRGTRYWNPQWTMTMMIREQLPYWEELSKRVTEDSELSERDDEQAEPATALYDYAPECSILVAENIRIDPSISEGTLSIGFRWKPQSAFGKKEVEGAIIGVRDRQRKSQVWLSSPLKEIYETYYPHLFEAPWIRLLEAPPLGDANSALGFLKREYPSVHREVCEKASKHRGGIVGFLAPQEVRKGEMFQDGWFLMAWEGLGVS
jgi:hypothetical protein